MDYAVVVQRLRDQTNCFKVVDFSLSMDALKQAGIPNMPACFVLPSALRAEPNKLATGAFHQATRETFQVYTFLKSVQKKLGGSAVDEQNAIQSPLFDALLGWTPREQDGLIELVRGSAVELRDGILVWLYEFAFDSSYRRTA